jgi:hypothetical protein
VSRTPRSTGPSEAMARDNGLADAIRLVGAEAEAEVRTMLAAHEREKGLAKKAPTLVKLQADLDRLAVLDTLGEFTLAALDPTGPILSGDEEERQDARLAGLEDLERLRVQLDALARLSRTRRRRVRVVVPGLSNGGARRADVLFGEGRGPPRWRLIMRAADLWAGAGHLVGIGLTTRFFAFAAARAPGGWRADDGKPDRGGCAKVARCWGEETYAAPAPDLIPGHLRPCDPVSVPGMEMRMVPAEAVAKFKRLRAKAEDLRAAYRRLHDKRERLRDHIGKQEQALSLASRTTGHNYLVGDDGELYTVLWHENEGPKHGGIPSRKHRKELRRVRDEGLARIATEISRLRQELAELDAHRGELSARMAAYSALVGQCREELARRGWREDGRVGHAVPLGERPAA